MSGRFQLEGHSTTTLDGNSWGLQMSKKYGICCYSRSMCVVFRFYFWICVPFAFYLRSICVLFAFHLRSISHQVPGTRYLAPGTRYQVPGTRYLVPGTKYLVPGIWYQVPGTRYLVPGTWWEIERKWNANGTQIQK